MAGMGRHIIGIAAEIFPAAGFQSLFFSTHIEVTPVR
jgi:hypothetical protein